MKKVKLSNVLKRLLDQKKISARELGRATGIAQSTISSILSDRGLHRPEHLFAISQYFGVSLETLLFGSDDRPPTLSDVLTTGIFEGWLRVKIEAAVPDKKKIETPDDN